MRLSNLCAECNVCEEVVPAQDNPRVLVYQQDEMPKQILVLDNNGLQDKYALAMEVASLLLGTEEFDYTTTIRCETSVLPSGVRELADVDSDVALKVIQSCGVWTRLVVEGYKLILSTSRGMVQLQLSPIPEKWSAVRSPRLGAVFLHIPPLLTLFSNDALIRECRPLVKRARKAAGV